MVLGVLALVLAAGWLVVSGPDEPQTKGAVLTPTTEDPSASPSPSLLSPVIDESPASPTAVASTAVPATENDQTVPCTDAELQVTPAAESVTLPRGQGTRLAIKIKNVSSRSCPRDVGADMQELFLQQDTAKVYSSDACDPKHGTSVRTLAPNIEHMFTVLWDGTSTAAGCSDRQPPPAGRYQLIGRLGTKLSEPIAVTIT